jgi:hypothetical protein
MVLCTNNAHPGTKEIITMTPHQLLKVLLMLALTAGSFLTAAQKNVLFLGNSYTYENNLPQMTADLSASAGDSLIFDSNTMGGATFDSHGASSVSMGKIMQGNWDYVILQGQSLEMFGNFAGQHPSPDAEYLDNVINVYNPCGETMYYMTWGRKNGIGGYSYELMDSMIHANYVYLADTSDGVVSPVGAVWRYIRQNYPLIELYQPDESHPSVAGTYAAACSFYSAIFRKDPSLCTFNSTLTPSDAAIIRSAAKAIVYDSLSNWFIGSYDSLFIGCPGTSVAEIPVSSTHIFPNPAADFVEIPVIYMNRSATLWDAGGKKVTAFKALPQSMNIKDLPSGIYLLRVDGMPSIRIMKN